MIHKTVLATALAVLALGTSASSASAFTNAPVGSTITGTLVSSTISLGSFSSCTGSTISGPVVTDNGPGNGGSSSVTSATYGGCQVFGTNGTWTATVPWGLFLGSAGGSIISVQVKLAWGTLSCTFQGGLSGAYTQSTGKFVLSGNLNRTAGSSLCPTPSAVSGTYNLRNSANAFVLL